MKRIKYPNPDGVKVYAEVIGTNTFRLLKFKDGLVTTHVPMGETAGDRTMFNKLVYYNQNIYTGHDVRKVARRIRNWVRKYQESEV